MTQMLAYRVNSMGSKRYPPGTNHFSPYSPIFRADQRVSLLVPIHRGLPG